METKKLKQLYMIFIISELQQLKHISKSVNKIIMSNKRHIILKYNRFIKFGIIVLSDL